VPPTASQERLPNQQKESERPVKLYSERKPMRFPRKSARSLVEFKPELVAGRVSPRPLLVISDREDMLVPEEEQLSVFRHAAEPKRFCSVYFGGHHLHDPKGFEVVMKLIRDWLAEYFPL